MAEIKQFKTFRDLKEISKENTPKTSNLASTTSITSSTSTTSPSNTINKTEVSPIRDFQKIPNSITRDAVPSGMFRGKSKLVYDLLWSKSRGKINPARTVKISRREIKKETAIGSMVTIDAALNHLQSTGLIQVIRSVGSLTGNQYEIFAPDELVSLSSISSITSPTQKMDILDILESGNTRETQTEENKDSYGNAKTFFKDFLNLDDDLRKILIMLTDASNRATGKGLTKKDGEALRELIEIIVAETDVARTRTKSVSVYLKFAVENLRRRLYAEKSKGKSKKPFEPGKTEITEVVIEPVESLKDDIKQTVLESLRQMVKSNGRESVEFFKNNYTSEDWDWLIANL
ncbi:MAG TPA: hypothetical protein VGC97_20450 [Pyrinomonadaceae bacterium]|jgi:hypothetical protein